MHLKNLVAVFIRIQVLAAMIATVMELIPFFASQNNPERSSEVIPTFFFLLLWLTTGVISWIFTEPLASFIAKGFDEPISLQSLTQEHVYIFGFIFIGLSVFISQLGPLTSTLHSMFKNEPYNSTQAYSSLIEIAFGLWLIFGCRKFYSFLKKFIEPKSESTKS